LAGVDRLVAAASAALQQLEVDLAGYQVCANMKLQPHLPRCSSWSEKAYSLCCVPFFIALATR
jgi:hypothetical protein